MKFYFLFLGFLFLIPAALATDRIIANPNEIRVIFRFPNLYPKSWIIVLNETKKLEVRNQNGTFILSALSLGDKPVDFYYTRNMRIANELTCKLQGFYRGIA